jgi:predicted RNase H-like HicB family nuclease
MRIRDVIRLIERDGWLFGRDAGQSPAVQAPEQAGTCYDRREAIRRSGIGHIEQRSQASRAQGGAVMRYVVVIEKADKNYSAYVPDLPGCVATGRTVEAVEAEIRTAVRFHIDGLRADGLPIPQPTSIAEYIDA